MQQKIEKLNHLLADSIVMYAKLHNYHWNIKGPEFFSVHQKTENYYNYFAELYDSLAERILQLGGTPIVTLKKSLAIARIQEEESTQITASHAWKNIVKDFEFFHREFAALSEYTQGDATTQALIDEQLGHFEKELWMLKATLN